MKDRWPTSQPQQTVSSTQDEIYIWLPGHRLLILRPKYTPPNILFVCTFRPSLQVLRGHLVPMVQVSFPQQQVAVLLKV